MSAENTGPCEHWAPAEGVCGEHGRRYLIGLCCPAHTPAALAGRPESIPDPARTLAGIRAAKGGPDVVAPMGASAGIDRAAVASGKRRSSPEAYREARA